MTTKMNAEGNETCPAQALLKLLSGKWKPEIFRLAANGPVRFNPLLRLLPGSNKQAVSLALKELEEAGLLHKAVVSVKPLHTEYSLTAEGRSLISVFEQLESSLGIAR